MEYTKKIINNINNFTGKDILDIIEYVNKDIFLKKDKSNLQHIIYKLVFIEENDNTYSNINIVCEYNFMIALALYKYKYNEEYYIDWKKPATDTYADLSYLIILSYFNINDDKHFIRITKELL